jgi:hypothetical protein
MASIELTPRELIVHVHGVDRVLAMRSSVSVPLLHVDGVREHAAEADFDDAVRESSRGIGTFVRGRVAAGTLRLPDGRAFYDVHDPKKAIVVDLRSEHFEHLVVEIDDEPPEAAARRIREAIARRDAWSEVLGQAPKPREGATTPVLHEPYGTPAWPAWKSALAIGTGVIFAPIAALAFLFLSPALIPLFVLALPRGRGNESRPA